MGNEGISSELQSACSYWGNISPIVPEAKTEKIWDNQTHGWPEFTPDVTPNLPYDSFH